MRYYRANAIDKCTQIIACMLISKHTAIALLKKWKTCFQFLCSEPRKCQKVSNKTHFASLVLSIFWTVQESVGKIKMCLKWLAMKKIILKKL